MNKGGADEVSRNRYREYDRCSSIFDVVVCFDLFKLILDRRR
jgi:hypothetical protein